MADNKKQDKKGPFPQNEGNFFKPNRFALIFLLIIILSALYLVFTKDRPVIETRKYSQFLERLESGDVASVSIVDDREIRYTLTSDPSVAYKTLIPYFDDQLLLRLQEKGIQYDGQKSDSNLLQIFLSFFPMLLLLIFFIIMMRGPMGASGKNGMSFGRSNARRYGEGEVKVRFKDVAGQAEAKSDLAEVVDFLKNKQKFIKLGAKIPKGILLVGPPGTGKTLLAKAVAGEAKVPFFSMSGSDFVEMFVGVGASRVRDLFDQGRKNAPCIIFIDELDAVGRKRGAGYGGGHDEREQTLNQMLVEMDGFGTQEGIIILAATNRPDVLDPALLRPGRFDRQVVVGLPDVAEREAILKIHTKNIPLGKDVRLDVIAKATPGFSGADLENLCNEAALLTARADKTSVTMDFFEEARDKVYMGAARKSMVLTKEEKRATAFHEAGHALLYYYIKELDPLHKVTIIPRGRALGVTFALPEHDKHSETQSRLLATISVMMGGYVAEKLIYGETTTGTQNDIKRATDLARQMVCEWGMSPLGFMAFGAESEPIFIGRELSHHKDYSEGTALKIDDEIRLIMKQCYERTEAILTEHIEQLKTLAEALIERETMDDKEIRILLGFPTEEKTPEETQTAADSGNGENSVQNEPAADGSEETDGPDKK